MFVVEIRRVRSVVRYVVNLQNNSRLITGRFRSEFHGRLIFLLEILVSTLVVDLIIQVTVWLERPFDWASLGYRGLNYIGTKEFVMVHIGQHEPALVQHL